VTRPVGTCLKSLVKHITPKYFANSGFYATLKLEMLLTCTSCCQLLDSLNKSDAIKCLSCLQSTLTLVFNVEVTSAHATSPCLTLMLQRLWNVWQWRTCMALLLCPLTMDGPKARTSLRSARTTFTPTMQPEACGTTIMLLVSAATAAISNTLYFCLSLYIFLFHFPHSYGEVLQATLKHLMSECIWSFCAALLLLPVSLEYLLAVASTSTHTYTDTTACACTCYTNTKNKKLTVSFMILSQASQLIMTTVA
jgi:hypothetical protein